MTELKAILRQRTGSYDEFYNANQVYAPGEHTHVTSGSHAGKWKVGDGVTAWRSLPFSPPDRTVGGNDNATGTVTDTGGNLSVPVPLTTVAPSASSTQTVASTGTFRAKFKVLVDNIAYLFSNKQNSLSRTVGGNDNATGTVTDTGGNLSVPVPLTTVAPSASSTQTVASTGTLRAKFKVLVDNIAYLFSNKQNSLSRTVGGNDNATGTVTDTGGNLSVPVPVTADAPSASSTQITAGTRTLRATLKFLFDNVAWIFTNKADLESPVFTGTPKVPSKTAAAGTDGTLIATEAQVTASVAAAKLSLQVWLAAVNTKADLPAPASLDPVINYLCRVMDDTDTPSNNGVWQLIAGNANWTYFSDNLDFIDEAELAEAIDANTEAWTAADSAEALKARAAEEMAQNTANLALDIANAAQNAADEAQGTGDEALDMASRDIGSIFDSLPPLLADRDGRLVGARGGTLIELHVTELKE